MALEKSVLTQASITCLLREHYGLQVQSAQKTALGSANCYRVSCGEGMFFLKEFQSRFSSEDLRREAELCNFLCTRNFPAARFLYTKSGAVYMEYQGHLLCMETFIDGKTYGYADLPRGLLPQMARTLGQLHQTLQGYPLPESMGQTWLAAYSPEEQAARYEELLQLAGQNPGDPHYEMLREELSYKKELSLRCGDYRKYYEGITYVSTHGDYQGCQLVWEGDTVKAVIDFSSACTLPAVWEVMRSYVQTSEDSRQRAAVDADGLCGYVDEYMKIAPLTRADLAAMPYVYLFQLARSAFGYREYLTTDSEDREALLQFAFWRTAMCREVEEKAERLSQMLIRLA